MCSSDLANRRRPESRPVLREVVDGQAGKPFALGAQVEVRHRQPMPDRRNPLVERAHAEQGLLRCPHLGGGTAGAGKQQQGSP